MYRKYHNQPTCIDGHHFPSKLEAECYSYLKLLGKAGEVSDIKFQQVFYLTKARISYKADFVVFHTKLQTSVVFEAKGMETERFRLIKKLWAEYGPCPMQIYYSAKKIVTIEPSQFPQEGA